MEDDTSPSAPLVWRGAGSSNHREPSDGGGPSGPDDPDWWAGGGDDDDGADAAAVSANLRARRNRRLAVIGGAGLLLATTVVTGTGGGGDGEPDVPVPQTSTADDGSSLPTVDASLIPGEPAGGTASIEPIEGGLRYGGAGGGADIRTDDAIELSGVDVSARPDRPFELGWTPARLPLDIGPSWSASIDVGVVESGDERRIANVNDVELAFGDGTLIVVAPVDTPDGAQGDAEVVVVALDATDGSPRWSERVPGDGARLIGVAAGVVGLDVGQGAERSVRLFDEIDGRAIPDGVERVAIASSVLFEQARGTREVDPETLDGFVFVPGENASDLIRDMAGSLTDGSAAVLVVDEVSVDRFVLLVADRLVGVRPIEGASLDDGGPLIVDWTRPGVMLLASPSETGATLLVSNRRGTQQQVVDAASGRIITELTNLSSSIAVYTPAWNGVIVKRPALVGSALVAVGLDGQPMWELLGTAPFAVGDGLIASAALGDEGLVVTARS